MESRKFVKIYIMLLNIYILVIVDISVKGMYSIDSKKFVVVRFNINEFVIVCKEWWESI